MHAKNDPFFSPNTHYFATGMLLLLLLFCGRSGAQIYRHDFGTTAFSAHPYVVAPAIIESHLSGSSWSNTTGAWTSTAGATGEAIRLTSAGNETITLTFNIAANFQADITSFDFWRQRSNLGPQNWSMTINGIAVGSGTTGIAGAALGNTTVTNAVSGLTGTVTIVLSLSGGTGNGTFRLDDFTLNGTVTSSCSGATITGFTPLTGPQNTLVTINGSGFTGATSVKFDNIPATGFNVISDSVIKAYVPAGNATGDISVTVNSCESFAPVGFTKIISVAVANFSSDIYISEIYDAQAGDGGVIEIYNGTPNPINLAGYTIRRYGDVGGATFYTINLTGIIPPGGIFLIGIGTGTTPCSITENQHYGTGFNSNDEFELYNGGTLIDNVHAPVNVGYSVIRNPNAVAPKAVFNGADWNTSTTESCANIGIHNVTTNTPSAITSPASVVDCENDTAVFTAALANPAGYTFQWKTLNASGIWVNVTNGAPYSGANTNTLTVAPLPAAFDDNQYYCQATSITSTVASNAAQLEVNPLVVPVFPTAMTICSGDTVPALGTVSSNGISGTWNPATISNTVGGSYIFTPNSGQCASSVTLVVTVNAAIVPNFATALTICSGDSVPALNTVSPNGISGTWNPAAISNTAGGSYIFTPNSGQCASSVTLVVTVNAAIVPNFATALTICSGDSVPALNTVSPNGISGTWNPATISNTVGGSYIFTPNSGQCASSVTLVVTVNTAIVPNFATALTICSGDAVATLDAVSPNGISGTWNPATISNTVGGSYIFTPNSGQCASSVTLVVTVNAAIVPNFATALTICSGDSVPTLNTVSPNGISGTWNPATISNTTGGSYIFTPNSGQCASGVTLVVTVNAAIVPNFATALTICSGDTVPTLNAVSPNGISGTWNPAAISNTVGGSYIFTPNSGQCASGVTLVVTVNTAIVPNFATALTICNGDAVPTLDAVSPNGISGTWNPAVINNTAGGSYIFTPNSGQCASGVTLVVTVNVAIVPNFATALTICSGDAVATLDAVSPNGISGTWNPATISNTAGGSYIFTPNSGQCASSVTLVVTVNAAIVPNFATALTICSGDAVPTLNAVSPNGISGTWNPAAISNTVGGSYIFTPNSGQCASGVTLVVTVNTAIVPNFATALTICNGDAVPTLDAVSPNGISGTWNPAAISNTAGGSYIFTPNSGQCASGVTLAVTVNALPNPNLQDTAICINPQTGQPMNPVSLYCGLPNSGYGFSWTLDGNPLPTATNTHIATAPGVYRVVVTNAITGCTGMAQATVAAIATATASVETSADFEDNPVVTVHTNGGSGAFLFQLDDFSPQQANQFWNVSNGWHTVTVTDANGCTHLVFEIFILDYPRFFTPNGDGYHDFWNIGGLSGQAAAKIHIFDRYGKLIKSIKPSEASGWDGTYNGRELPATDYWFELFYQDRDGLNKEFKSHFSLKR